MIIDDLFVFLAIETLETKKVIRYTEGKREKNLNNHKKIFHQSKNKKLNFDFI